MYNGSRTSYEENVKVTRQVADMARKKGVSSEGELGKVPGLEGVPGAHEEEVRKSTDLYTDPEQAVDYVKRTGVDALAVSIGTVHGVYKAVPKLDIARLKEIRKRVSTPLVLHGGSDTPNDQIKRTIEEGIAKINVATDLRLAYMRAANDFMVKTKGKAEVADLFLTGRNAVRDTVKEKITLFGSAGIAK